MKEDSEDMTFPQVTVITVHDSLITKRVLAYIYSLLQYSKLLELQLTKLLFGLIFIAILCEFTHPRNILCISVFLNFLYRDQHTLRNDLILRLNSKTGLFLSKRLHYTGWPIKNVPELCEPDN